jgi:alkaline phosphatase D
LFLHGFACIPHADTMKSFLLPLVALAAVLNASLVSATDTDSPIKIAFGSCNHQDGKQPMWQTILKEEPSIWIWLGDNVYGDTKDMSVMRAKYDKLKSRSDYTQLRRMTRVFATWDDHDYGVNDGGKYYPMKKESKAEFIRFVGFPEDHEIHTHEGIYYHEDIELEGLKVRIIMLDTRYFRDRIFKKKEPGSMWARYQPNYEGTLLGVAQWEWLEPKLNSDEFDFCIIGSSIQLIAEEHAWEKWANFPNERARLLDLIATKCPGKVVVISGDRHHSEISKLDIEGTGKILLDVTSSGLNKRGSLENEPNKHRIGPFNGMSNYGLISIDPNSMTATYEIKGVEQNVISSFEQKFGKLSD